MNNSALMVCKAFLDRSPSEEKEELKSLLSESQQEQMNALPPVPMPRRELLFSDWLDEIHPSWLAPFLRTLSKSDIPLFLSSLESKQSHELQKLLGYTNHLPKLTSLGRLHLRQTLYDQLLPKDLLPLAFIPESPLNPLLFMDHQKIELLIRFLGLHDLSFEMRHIIATTILKKIFHGLPKIDGDYLKTLLLHREPLVFQRLFLEKWDGTKEHLRKLLEERGMIRLGIALHNQDPNFLWYFTHRMEMHLAIKLLKYRDQPLPNERAEKILIEQIKKILTYLDVNMEAAA